NALAHAGVLALARGEGIGLSPIVVHGPSGAGKSRLLEGLVAEWLARWPGSAVAHLAAETFAALCGEAAERPGGWSEFRERFRALDLLVLDDLPALERAPLALAELGHTFDALEESGAAVAVSARSGPGQWSGWPARLVNRLIGGLSVRIDPPGPESRRRYVLERARSRGLRLAAEAVEALAEAADGYRTLDGWLARLALAGRGAVGPLDRAEVEALLADEIPPPRVDIDRVAREVCARFGVRLRDLRSEDRHRGLVEPRHLAILLARELTGLSFAALGAYFGGRDPKTIRHACQAAARRIEADPALAATAEALRRRWMRREGSMLPSE
ncbi:MAG: hypothetical protein IRY99_14240, partial [Isosphaeraceae bacterium]|nr:hypothetical protein [Isosphaeraceae bacterium]